MLILDTKEKTFKRNHKIIVILEENSYILDCLINFDYPFHMWNLKNF